MFSSISEFESSVPSARLLVQCGRHRAIARPKREENQPEARPGPGPKGSVAQAVQTAPGQRHHRRSQQRLRYLQVQSRQSRYNRRKAPAKTGLLGNSPKSACLTKPTLHPGGLLLPLANISVLEVVCANRHVGVIGGAVSIKANYRFLEQGNVFTQTTCKNVERLNPQVLEKMALTPK